MIVEIFKGWISSMLCIGIFVAFIQLIMPKSNLKKYIYSLIGIVTIVTVISPIVNALNNDSVQTSVEQVLNNISGDGNLVDEEGTKKLSEDNVKKEFIQSIKNDIEQKLKEKNISVTNVNIIINEENYDIDLIEVNIKKIDDSKSSLGSVSKVVDYLNEEYDIDYSKITVIEEGS